MLNLNQTLGYLTKSDKEALSQLFPLTNHEIAILIHVLEKQLEVSKKSRDKTRNNEIVRLSSLVLLRKLRNSLNAVLPPADQDLP
jgi:hypothetical protein